MTTLFYNFGSSTSPITGRDIGCILENIDCVLMATYCTTSHNEARSPHYTVLMGLEPTHYVSNLFNQHWSFTWLP